MSKVNSFGAADFLEVGSKNYRFFRLDAVDAAKLPFSLKILLENLLRTEDGANITEIGRASCRERVSSPV